MNAEVKEAVATRAEIVELCYKHIEECEKWEKRLINDKRNEERHTLMSGGTPGLFNHLSFSLSLSSCSQF